MFRALADFVGAIFELIGNITDVIDAVNAKESIVGELQMIGATVGESLWAGEIDSGGYNEGQKTLMDYAANATADFMISTRPLPSIDSFQSAVYGAHEGIDECLNITTKRIYDEVIEVQTRAAKQMAAGALLGVAAEVIGGDVLNAYSGRKRIGEVDESQFDAITNKHDLEAGFSMMSGKGLSGGSDAMERVFRAIDAEKIEFMNRYGTLTRYYDILQARDNAEVDWWWAHPGSYYDLNSKNPYSGGNKWSVKGWEHLAPENDSHFYIPNPKTDWVAHWNKYGIGDLG